MLTEIFNTECYTLIDALIWCGLGVFAGISIMSVKLAAYKAHVDKIIKIAINDAFGVNSVYADTDSIKIIKED